MYSTHYLVITHGPYIPKTNNNFRYELVLCWVSEALGMDKQREREREKQRERERQTDRVTFSLTMSKAPRPSAAGQQQTEARTHKLEGA